MDNVGNRTAVTETQGVIRYTYDSLHRLVGASFPNTTTVAYGYAYDPTGNRTLYTDTVGITTTYSYDAADRMLSAGATTYTWDNNGNQRTKVDATGTITYTYDYANRLKALTGLITATYGYDGDGLRIQKTASGSTTNYLWDKALVLPVIITDSNSLYLYGLSLVAQQTGQDVGYYHADGLGSVRDMTDASGERIVSYRYDPFGGLNSTTGSRANDFQFTGQQNDAESGLYYLRARTYDAAAGRFLTRDPVTGSLMRPQSLNPHTYVEGNPQRWIDPSGRCIGWIRGDPDCQFVGLDYEKWDYEGTGKLLIGVGQGVVNRGHHTNC